MATLISALISVVGEGSGGSSNRDRFCNASMGYYLVLMNTASAQERYGQEWQDHYLRTATIRNIVHYFAGVMLGCMTELVPDQSTFQEKVCEHHFSKLKAPWRGTPSLRECIYSTHSVHVASARSQLRLSEAAAEGSSLPLSEAQRLFEESFRLAANFQAWISDGRRPKDGMKSFDGWAESGRVLVTQNLNVQEDEDDDEMEEELVEALDSEDPEEAANLHIVQTVEDLAEAKQKLAEAIEDPAGDGVMGALGPPEVETTAAEKPTDSQIMCALGPPEVETTAAEKPADPQIMVEVETTAAEKPADPAAGDGEQLCEQSGPGSFAFYVRSLKEVDGFAMTLDEDLSIGNCLKRYTHLVPIIKSFSSAARLREGIMSRAQLLPKKAAELSGFHKLEHELALARAATLGDGRRMSRSALWCQTQAKICQSQAERPTGDLLQPVRNYKPFKDGKESPQILVVNDVAEGLVYVAVLTVYRGTVVKTKKGRKARLSKPSVTPLVPSQCKGIRVARLSWIEKHRLWFVCAASPCNVYDPLGTVVGEVPVNEVFAAKLNEKQEGKWLVKVPDPTLDYVLHLRAHPELLTEVENVPEAMQKKAAAAGEIQLSEVTWTHRDFGRSVKGAANLERFLEMLPKIYAQKEVPLLDDAGFIQKQDSGRVPWSHVVRRAASYFDVSIPDNLPSSKKAEEYGKAVVQTLNKLLPGDNVHKSRELVRNFASSVDYRAQPLP